MRFVIVIAMWVALLGYVGMRLIHPTSLSKRGKAIAWALVASMAVLPLITMVLIRTLGADGAVPVYWAGFLTMGLASILILAVMIKDGITLAVRGIKAITGKPRLDPERRQFLSDAVSIGVAGSSIATAGVATVGAIGVPMINRVDVRVPGLDPELDGLTIAHLTDIHVGPTIKRRYLAALVEATNALEPDIIAVTGDLVDGMVDELEHHVAPLAELRSKLGTFYVTGNHEYYWDGPGWVEAARRLGMDALENEHRVFEVGGAKLCVAGIHDHSAPSHVAEHASDPKAAFDGAPLDAYRILLAHQPISIRDTMDVPLDLQLSGHTHGGQYFPWSVLVHLAQPYVAGLHEVGDRLLWVSRGCAYWGPPMRLGAPREIALLTLRSQPAEPVPNQPSNG